MSQSGLTVRQHERQSVDLPVELEIDAAHAAQVRFSAASRAVSPTVVRGRAVDVSSGGMGIQVGQFLPRMCEGVVRVFGAAPQGTDLDGGDIYPVIFEHPVKVRRVVMYSHEPGYELGVSFVDQAPDLHDRLGELMASARGETPETRGGGGGGDA